MYVKAQHPLGRHAGLRCYSRAEQSPLSLTRQTIDDCLVPVKLLILGHKLLVVQLEDHCKQYANLYRRV